MSNLQTPESEVTAIIREVQPTRIAIIDDNFVMRSGLRSALELEADMEIVGEGENGLDAVRIAEELQPDLLIMDFRMPRLDGIAATRRIIESQPNARIVITTWNDEPQTLVEAILAGAKGYLIHGHFTLPELVSAVRAVRAGGALISPSLAPVLLELVKKKAASAVSEAQGDLETRSGSADHFGENLLTRRERDILEMVQQGKTNREIADTLSIEEKTVKNHINNIYSKMHLRNRYEAIALRLHPGNQRTKGH